MIRRIAEGSMKLPAASSTRMRSPGRSNTVRTHRPQLSPPPELRDAERQTDDGEWRHTRITEAMSRFTCDGLTGYGMAEYLDQMVDGKPVGRHC